MTEIDLSVAELLSADDPRVREYVRLFEEPFEIRADRRDRPGGQGGGRGWEVDDSARCRNCGHRRDWHYRGRCGCDYGPEYCVSECREFLSPVLEDMELCRCGHRREVHGGPCWTDNDNSSSEPDCDCLEFTPALA